MPNLYVLIGPPGCGKSTWCKTNTDWRKNVRVNRDELRTMFLGRYQYGIEFIEKMVTRVTRDIVHDAFCNGKDVILDNTNCSLKTIRSIIQECPQGVNIKWVTFEVPFFLQRWNIFKRWMKGGLWIPYSVSVTMNKGYKEVVEFIRDRPKRLPNFKSLEEVKI